MSVTEESFNNVYISDGGYGITLYERTPGGGMGTRLATFKNDEYDVKVTFKKKPRPIVAGDLVCVHGELGTTYNVLALNTHTRSCESQHAWIYNMAFTKPRTVSVSNLYLAP